MIPETTWSYVCLQESGGSLLMCQGQILCMHKSSYGKALMCASVMGPSIIINNFYVYWLKAVSFIDIDS